MNIGRTQWGEHAMANTTHTHSVPRDTQGGWSLGQGSDTILTHVDMAPPLVKLMGYEHREDGGSIQCQTNTYTHTHSVPLDTQRGWSLGQGSDAIMTHVSVARPLIKLLGCEHRKEVSGGTGSRQWQTQTNTHTHTHCVPRDTQGGWSRGQ